MVTQMRVASVIYGEPSKLKVDSLTGAFADVLDRRGLGMCMRK